MRSGVDTTKDRPRAHRLRSLLATFAAVIAAGAAAAGATAAPSDLDPAFGTGGVTSNNVIPGNEPFAINPTETILLADGRTVVAGNAGGDVFVARLLADGTVDGTFGGVRVYDLDAGSFDELTGMAVDSSGRLVLAGRAGDKAFLMRLTTGGNLDASFAGGGKRLDTDPSGFINWADMALDTDDGIYVINTGVYPSKVYRFLPSGAPDTAYGIDGVSNSTLNLNDLQLALDSVGRPVVAGVTTAGTSVVVYRLNQATALFPGYFDLTFNGGGSMTLPTTTGSLLDLEIDGANRPVVLQSLGDGYRLARVTDAGVLDAGFDTDGLLDDPVGATLGDRAADLEISGTNMLVAGGRGSGAGFITARTVSGGLDGTYATAGLLTLTCDVPGASCAIRDLARKGLAYAAALQPLGGATAAQVGQLSATGTPDLAFGGDGQVTVAPLQPWQSTVTDSVMAADGSIITLGEGGIYGDESSYLTRQRPDGGLDPTFGSGGVIVTDLQIGSDMTSALALAPNGLLYVITVEAGGPHSRLGIRRFSSTGLDASFGTAGRVVHDFGGTSTIYGTSARFDGSGRLVVGGGEINSGPPETRRVWIARFDATTGAFDPGFNGGAPRYTDFPGAVNESVRDLVVRPDGRIVGVGSGDGVVGAVGLNSDGTPDTGFGTGGMRMYPELAVADAGGAVRAAWSPAGVVMAATVSPPTGTVVQVTRLTDTGAPDMAFGSSAVTTIGRGLPDRYELAGITVDRFGRALVAGRVDTGTRTDSFVARLLATGQVDPAFGGGVVVRDLSGGAKNDGLSRIFERPTGRLAAVGTVVDPASSEYRLLTAQLVGEPVVAAQQPPTAGQPPVSRPARTLSSTITVPRHRQTLRRAKFVAIRGQAAVTGGTLRRVQISVRRIDPKRCRYLRNPKASFTSTAPVAKRCPKPVWLTVRGTSRWRYALTKQLPAGRYEIRSRSVLTDGTIESRFALRRNIVRITLK